MLQSLTFIPFIIFPLFWLLMMTIGIGGTIFWIIMLIHVSTHEVKDKTTWVLVVALTHIIGAVIYYFMVKKPFDDMVLANGGQIPPSNNASMPQPMVAQVATKSSALAITALVLGFIAFIPGIGFIAAIVAITLGFISRSHVKKGTAEGKGMALTGILLGFAGIIIWALLMLLPFLFFIIAAASSK